MAKILIIDGNAVLHRAFHALPPLTNKFGPVGAVYGFFSILMRASDQVKPDYLWVAFDHPGPNFRHQLFVGYQARRPEMPAELQKQSRLTQKILQKADIPQVIRAGVEADDVIGSLATRLAKRHRVYILTGDHDLMQLVSRHIKLVTWRRRIAQLEVIDKAAVKRELGISPRQVVDYKALVGDSSDEYPGVNGIGPKTARQLLQRYHSLKNIYRHLSQIAPRWQEKLRQGEKEAELSYQLATILTNLKIKLKLRQARWDQETLRQLGQVLALYRLPSLARRIDKKLAPLNVQKTLF